MATITRMSAAPTAPSGRWRMKSAIAEIQRARRGALRLNSSRVCGVTAMCLAVADARIDPRVRDVDEEVDQQEKGRYEHDQGLHEGVVAVRDRVDEQHAEPV